MEEYAFEINNDLILDDFEVVRREFFYHLNEPSITFCDGKVGVNSACIRRLPDNEFVQFLVSKTLRKLILRPCMESDVHSLRWCNTVHEKRKPRTVTGKVFYFMICDLMNWETRNRYKVMGKPIMANGEKLILFDLNSVETYEHNGQEGEKGKISRKPVLPNEWKGSFGIPYKEQKNALQISIFDQNYVVYSVVDNPTDVPADHMTDVTE